MRIGEAVGTGASSVQEQFDQIRCLHCGGTYVAQSTERTACPNCKVFNVSLAEYQDAKSMVNPNGTAKTVGDARKLAEHFLSSC